MGAGRREALRPIGFGGAWGSGWTVIGSFALVFVFAGDDRPRFTGPSHEVAALAARLLLVAAIFQIFDGGQVVGSGRSAV